MEEKLITLQDVRDTLKFKETDDLSLVNTITQKRPASIINHISDEEFIILGMTPDEFMRKHGGDVFDFEQLIRDFKDICKDYEIPLTHDSQSMAVDFCSKIIYMIGPLSRSVKQNTTDKVWAFKFPYNIDNKLVVKVAYVCTFKAKNAKYDPKSQAKDTIILSVRHASLLAMKTMNRITDICCEMPEPVIMLTPLCGAIFSKIDISDMLDATKLPAADLIKMLNSSCQSGGHYLEESSLSVAAVASIVATRNLSIKKKDDERVQIITKIIKQYLNHHKSYDEELFCQMAIFATGGVPSNLEPPKLISLFKKIKETTVRGAMGAMAMAEATSMKVAKKDMLRTSDSKEDEDEFALFDFPPAPKSVVMAGPSTAKSTSFTSEEMVKEANAIKSVKPAKGRKEILATYDKKVQDALKPLLTKIDALQFGNLTMEIKADIDTLEALKSTGKIDPEQLKDLDVMLQQYEEEKNRAKEFVSLARKIKAAGAKEEDLPGLCNAKKSWFVSMFK